MVPLEGNLSGDAGLSQKTFDAAGETERERSHREAESSPPENIGCSPDMTVLLQDNNSASVLGELGGATKPADACTDDDDIPDHYHHYTTGRSA